MGRTLRAVIGHIHQASLRPCWHRFQRATRDPAPVQAQRLEELLAKNGDTAYGREHGMSKIRSIRDFQQRVPIVDHDTLSPWLERVLAGEKDVLTRSFVRAVERSGGSTSHTKLIPYTDALLAEFQAATGPWMYDLAAHHPKLRGTQSYWSVSPVAQEPMMTPGGIPIGFEDDSEYLGPLHRWALRHLLAVPAEAARIPDMDEWRTFTCHRLLAARDLGLISVWSPSFLTLLLQYMEAHLDDLIKGLPHRRAAEVRAARAADGRLQGERIWPRLQVISCWRDGPSADPAEQLRRWFPSVTIQGKGLLATEGVVSFPLSGHPGGVLAITSHFLEFIDLLEPTKRPMLAHELVDGRCYSPLLTTGGGLFRYHLKDVVRCIGHYNATPLVVFESRLDRVSDLRGEKVHESHAQEAIRQVHARLKISTRFSMITPVMRDPPAYTLYLETEGPFPIEQAGRIVDESLARAHTYRYCRELGQLAPARAVPVKDAWAAYERALVASKQRAGDVKPTALDPRPIWQETFEGGSNG